MTEASLNELYLDSCRSLERLSEQLTGTGLSDQILSHEIDRLRGTAAALYLGAGRELERFSRSRRSRRKPGA